MNSRNTKDVMVTFHPPTLRALDLYCKRTGLKRSTAVMQALGQYLAAYGAAGAPRVPLSAEHEPHDAAPATSSVKRKLRRGK